jgi:hypothetical protein
MLKMLMERHGMRLLRHAWYLLFSNLLKGHSFQQIKD